MQKNLYFLLLLFSLGCKTEIDIELLEEDPKLTLNCFFKPDSVLNARLTLSRHVLKEGPHTPVSNGSVIIYQDGIAYDTLIDVGNGDYHSIGERKPAEGKIYEIKATAPGLPSVSARSYATDVLVIDKIELSESKENMGFLSYDHTLKLTFKDDPLTEDYYDFKIFEKYDYKSNITNDTIRKYSPVPMESDISNTQDAIIFDDVSFSGKEVTVIIKAEMHNESRAKYFLHVRKLSKELYRFRVTSLKFGADPFSEPVSIYSNITEGYGIFGGYSESIVELK